MMAIKLKKNILINKQHEMVFPIKYIPYPALCMNNQVWFCQKTLLLNSKDKNVETLNKWIYFTLSGYISGTEDPDCVPAFAGCFSISQTTGGSGLQLCLHSLLSGSHLPQSGNRTFRPQ